MAVVSKLEHNGKDITKYNNSIIRNIALNGEDYHFASRKNVEHVICSNAVNEPLFDMQILGNSIQDGTLTMEAPVEVESVGEKTLNLFQLDNVKYATSGLATTIDTVNNTITFDNTNSDAANYKATKSIQAFGIKPNTTYTSRVKIITETVQSGGTSAGSMLRSLLLQDNGSYSSNDKIYIVNGYYNYTIDDKGYYYTTFTTPEDMTNLTYITTRITGYGKVTYQDLMIVEGEYTKDNFPAYEPFGYKVPVKIRGKNLFDINSVELKNCEIVDNGIEFTGSGDFDIKLPAGNYTISFDRNVSATCYLRNGKVGSGYITTIDADATSKTFVFSASVDGYLRFSSFKKGLILSNIQIEESETATDYEPYIEPATTNIYLKEPLRRVGDYVDYIDYKNKKVIRNTTYYTFIGDESIAVPSKAIAGFTPFRYVELHNVAKQPFVCNYLPYLNSDYGDATAECLAKYSTSGQMFFIISNERIPLDDVEAFKNLLKELYLSEKPLKVYYGLKNPTEETINVPEISTFDGKNIFGIDTSIQPSGISINYWKQIGVDKVENEIVQSGTNLLIVATSANITQNKENLVIGG